VNREPTSSRTLKFLVALLVAEVLVASTTRIANLAEVLGGGAVEWSDYVSAYGAVLVPAVLFAAWWGYRQVGDASASARADRDELLLFAAASHDWLWRSDPHLRLTFSNPAVAEVLGYSPREVVGRSLLEFIHPDDQGSVQAAAHLAATTGETWRDLELRWRHSDGHDVVLQGSGAPVRDRNGELIGFTGARRVAPMGEQARKDANAARRRVQQVLDSGDLHVALQPIIDLSRDRWVAAEALARFPDGRGPDRWFADAQAGGLALELELLALRTAVGVLPQLPPDVALSLNASPSLILDPRLREALVGLGPQLTRITLEITEHAEVTAYDDIHDALAPLREHGMRLAVDDTGAGYSSFAHVLRLRPDVIKLDRTLVAGIDHDAARRAFVTAIVLLALELGAAVTGEGVETAGELEALRLLGVDQAQGFHLGRPTVSKATWSTWPQRRWSATAGTPSAIDA
jgi:PAS domain S-box-containing protein